jgi:hypothetical protein
MTIFRTQLRVRGVPVITGTTIGAADGKDNIQHENNGQQTITVTRRTV